MPKMWLLYATKVQRQRLAQAVRTVDIHYAFNGWAACDYANTGAALTQLPSLVTCPACRRMTVWAFANLAEVTREVSIRMTERFAMAGEALRAGRRPGKR